jgi:hypothetical protein
VSAVGVKRNLWSRMKAETSLNRTDFISRNRCNGVAICITPREFSSWTSHLIIDQTMLSRAQRTGF